MVCSPLGYVWSGVIETNNADHAPPYFIIFQYTSDISGNLLNVTTLFIVVSSQIFFAGIAFRDE